MDELAKLALAPGAGRRIALGPLRMRVLDDGSGSGGAVAIAEFLVPLWVCTTPTHVHRAHDEGFYALAGTLEVRVGDATVPAGRGQARFLNTFAPPRYLESTEKPGA
jgi:mannose-6-phosphate isomerase-like protein (cupin superfamily)